MKFQDVEICSMVSACNDGERVESSVVFAYLGLQCSVIYWAPTEMYFEIKLWIHRTGEDVNVSFFRRYI